MIWLQHSRSTTFLRKITTSRRNTWGIFTELCIWGYTKTQFYQNGIMVAFAWLVMQVGVIWESSGTVFTLIDWYRQELPHKLGCKLYKTTQCISAHATSPALGQGANQAMQDGYLVGQYLAKFNTPEEAFSALFKASKPISFCFDSIILLVSLHGGTKSDNRKNNQRFENITTSTDRKHLVSAPC